MIGSKPPAEANHSNENAATYDLLAVSSNHPDQFAPYRCVFNERSFRSTADESVSITVVSPKPFAPPVGPYSEMSKLPSVQRWKGYELHHPRFFYLLPKRLFYPLSGKSFRKRVSAYIKRNLAEPDIIQANHLYIDGWGMLDYADRIDVPLIVVSHGMLNQYHEYSSTIQKRLRTVLRQADLIASVSRELAKRAESLVEGVNTEVVPIGADPSRFEGHDRSTARKELSIAESKPVVLFCGQLIRRKGVDVLIKAIQRTDEEFEMVFVTNGGALEEKVRELDQRTGRDIRVYKEVSDTKLASIFVAADLLVLPSRSEGRPTVIYEAMASETAVLASRTGGVPEQVVHGETGVLLESVDPQELTERLEELIADLSATRSMGQQGYRRLLQKGWTWADHGQRMRSIHKQYLS